jgi:hypothetical protein
VAEPEQLGIHHPEYMESGPDWQRGRKRFERWGAPLELDERITHFDGPEMDREKGGFDFPSADRMTGGFERIEQVERQMAAPHPMLEPFVPTTGDPFDRVKAAHLLNRAGFGGTADEIDEGLELGPARAVERLLDFPDANADEHSRTDVPDLSAIEGYPRTFAERRELFVGKTPEERMMINNRLMAANREAMQATVHWWMTRMADGPYPLQEKLTLFWHGHFTTSARDERSAWLMWQQNETLRRNAAGNFRTFVREISRDPAMLDYLNNQQNRKQSPNENYARELMELFTLGIGNYTEDDIKQAARAFTGWAHDGDDFIFRRQDHDTGEKIFFGRRGNWGGDDVIDIILQHNAAGPYIASKLINFFVTDYPDPAIAGALGKHFRDVGYNLRPVLRMLFTSKLFYSDRVIGAQIKSPIQLVVGTVRNLNVQMPDARALNLSMQQMGQVPFDPPNVRGWPGGRLWINTSTLFMRYNTAMNLAGGAPVGRLRRGAAFKPEVVRGSAKQVAEAWVERLIQRPVAADRIAVLADALGNAPEREDNVRKMVQLIVSMPEYQLC